ncbi:hypothetical protein AC481_06215 [miscellaneous Crenarchaeota group archaeon SMTZ-80]|nr:MAG: hypothetical protein AC481_06215 [miscellaneous Crenarchaeota group archaeon SMTZ-80]
MGSFVLTKGSLYDKRKIFNRIKEFWPETNGNWYAARHLLLKPEILKLVKQGYSQEEIRNLFPSPFSEDGVMSRTQIYNIFKDCFEEQTFINVQKDNLGDIIDSLIEQGFVTPTQIATKIKGMNARKVWTFLVNNKENYLISLISSFISKGYITTIQLADQLDIDQWNVERFIERSMRGIRIEKLELFDKPRARKLIVESETAEDLLRGLGYSESTIKNYRFYNKIQNIINDLFDGMSFDDAKLFYTSHYLGN